MSRWYVAALLIAFAAVVTAFSLPPIDECTALPGAGPGLNQCGGVQISPAFVVLIGAVMASCLVLVGFLRSAR